MFSSNNIDKEWLYFEINLYEVLHMIL